LGGRIKKEEHQLRIEKEDDENSEEETLNFGPVRKK
jgi:hypothetical protein